MISATWGSSALTLSCIATVSDKASLALTSTPCPPLHKECYELHEIICAFLCT